MSHIHHVAIILTVALAATLLLACATPRVRFVPAADRATDLPGEAPALLAMADDLSDSEQPKPSEVDRVMAALEKANAKGANAYDVAWRMARAANQMIEVLHFADERKRYAAEGHAHAKKAVDADADRVEGHYFLAIMTARTAEASNNIELIKHAVASAERAAAIDALYDHAAALRFLGKIYITAPPWPTSVGAPDKAIEVLERALSLAPHPLSRIFLGEAYYHDEAYDDARQQLRRALQEAEQHPLAERWISEARDYLRRLGNASGPSEGSDF